MVIRLVFFIKKNKKIKRNDRKLCNCFTPSFPFRVKINVWKHPENNAMGIVLIAYYARVYFAVFLFLPSTTTTSLFLFLFAHSYIRL